MRVFTIVFFIIVSCCDILYSQTHEDDFEFRILRNFGFRNGTLDSNSTNPRVTQINPKPISIKYKRNEYSRYDNIKIYPERKLIDVSSYATYEGNPPKLSMKVFTTAPIATLVEIQLGSKSDDNYPTGIHSLYQAYTTVQNQWENLEFKFAIIPEGSQVKSTDVNKLTIVFSPNSLSSDLYYFDDLIGPPLIPENETIESKVK